MSRRITRRPWRSIPRRRSRPQRCAAAWTSAWARTAGWPGRCGSWALPTQALRHSQAARTLAQEGRTREPDFALLLGSFRASVSPRSSSGARPSNGRDHAGDGQGFRQRLAHATVLHGWAWPDRARAKRVGPRSARGSPPPWPRDPCCFYSRTAWACWRRRIRQADTPTRGWRCWPRHEWPMAVTGVQWYAAELSRLKGALLLRQAIPDVPQAEACFSRPSPQPTPKQAKSWELRAAMSTGPAVAVPGQRHREACRAARAGLWLVHRGL